MEALIMAGQLILGLSILVGLHELGHLAAAKIFKMRVEKYSIGFPPKLFGVKWGETEYSLGAIPLGGFVKISGMIDESLDKEQMKKEPQPWEFRSKPAWQRLIVMMGGIIVNVITGILIFILLTYFNGEQYLPASALKDGIVANELAQKIGLQTGDVIVNVNGKSLERFSDVYNSEVLLSSNSYYTVEREGKEIRIDIPNDLIEDLSEQKDQAFIEPLIKEFSVEKLSKDGPGSKAGLQEGDVITKINEMPIHHYHELKSLLEENKGKKVVLEIQRGDDLLNLEPIIDQEGKLGYYPKTNMEFATRKFSFFESVPIGTQKAFTIIFDNIRGFRKIFRGEVSASKSLSGPIGIAQIFGGTWDWINFWRITAILSMILAFMNFLPIPALDGGHVMFLVYEIVSGRKPSDKFLEVAQKIGMFLLLALMVFVIFNDIFKVLF